jgi:hypothetical protein
MGTKTDTKMDIEFVIVDPDGVDIRTFRTERSARAYALLLEEEWGQENGTLTVERRDPNIRL